MIEHAVFYEDPEPKVPIFKPFCCEVFIEKENGSIEKHGNFFETLKEASSFKNSFFNKKFHGKRIYGYISKVSQEDIDQILNIMFDTCNFGFNKPGKILEEFKIEK